MSDDQTPAEWGDPIARHSFIHPNDSAMLTWIKDGLGFDPYKVGRVRIVVTPQPGPDHPSHIEIEVFATPPDDAGVPAEPEPAAPAPIVAEATPED